MVSYFSKPNDTKYLVPSQAVIDPSISSKLIHSVFLPNYVLDKMA